MAGVGGEATKLPKKPSPRLRRRRVMILTDEYGRPLPKGTVVDLQPHSPHTAVVGYNGWNQQVIGHNSKQHGRAVISNPEVFNDFG
jgi:hypothetical protein